MSGLLGKIKVAQFEHGIHENCLINAVSTDMRKGKNGPINKMIYIKYSQIEPSSGKRKKESELGWWKPDPTSDYFISNLRELCVQLNGILSCYMPEDEAFDVFKDVFDANEFKSHVDVETKSWKKSEVDIVFDKLQTAFAEAIKPFVGSKDLLMRLKLTTNYKGEDIDIPKYGVFTEPMSVKTSNLKFSNSELKTHSKAGNVNVKKTSNLNSNIEI